MLTHAECARSTRGIGNLGLGLEVREETPRTCMARDTSMSKIACRSGIMDVLSRNVGYDNGSTCAVAPAAASSSLSERKDMVPEKVQKGCCGLWHYELNLVI
jgi:hypothetical protein